MQWMYKKLLNIWQKFTAAVYVKLEICYLKKVFIQSQIKCITSQW